MVAESFPRKISKCCLVSTKTRRRFEDHIENRMTYARLLSDRVSAFSAIADAEKYDHKLEGIKAQEAAAKADYERAAKYVQYNSPISVLKL